MCERKVGGWGTTGQGEKLSCRVGLAAIANSKAKIDPSELSPIGPKWPGLCTSISIIIEGRDLGQSGAL